MDILKVYHNNRERRSAFRAFSAETKFHHSFTALTESGDRYVFAHVETLRDTERYTGCTFGYVSIADSHRITPEARERLLTLQRQA